MTPLVPSEAFGIGIVDLPGAQPPPIGQDQILRWQHVSGKVIGDPEGWIRLVDLDVEVGWPGWASYRVSARDGTVDVVVDAVSPAEAGIAFLVSVLPLALPLFGVEPIHGSAVSVGDGGALLMLGDRGAGKSTLAGKLNSLGHEFVTDDTCAIDLHGLLLPGPPIMAPRHDDLGQPVTGQYNAKLLREPFGAATGALKPTAVALLSPAAGAQIRLEEVGRREAFETILGNARANWFLQERRQAMQLAVVAQLSGKRVRKVTYDPRSPEPDTVAKLLSTWVEQPMSVR